LTGDPGPRLDVRFKISDLGVAPVPVRFPISNGPAQSRRNRIGMDSPRERLATAWVDALPAVRLPLPGPQKRGTAGTLNWINAG
jgi:hypothetical protein